MGLSFPMCFWTLCLPVTVDVSLRPVCLCPFDSVSVPLPLCLLLSASVSARFCVCLSFSVSLCLSRCLCPCLRFLFLVHPPCPPPSDPHRLLPAPAARGQHRPTPAPRALRGAEPWSAPRARRHPPRPCSISLSSSLLAPFTSLALTLPLCLSSRLPLLPTPPTSSHSLGCPAGAGEAA